MKRSDYQFLVQVPLSGFFYLAQWQTHNQGNHLVLARTEKALHQTLIRVLDKYGENISFGEAFRMEMVTPPASRVEKYLDEVFQWDLIDFKNQLTFILLQYKIDLPFVTPCQDHEEDWCDNCTNGFVSDRWQELFELYGERFNLQKEIEPVGRVSDARILEDVTEEIWVVYGEFGHHHSGLSISLFFEIPDLLFCFRKLEEVSLQAIKDAQTELKRKSEKNFAEVEKISNKLFELRRQEERKKWMEFFQSIKGFA